ncbi:MAG: carboxypeptidase-like regulatory domain-containing protein, partial [Planctomycetota bacterium]
DIPEPDPEALPEEADLTMLPTIGHRTAAEAKTDAAGRFRINADANSAIRIVTAYRRGYMPEMVAVRGPTEDVRVVLQAAGQVIGTVIDKETRQPISGADVAINVQQKAIPVGETGFSGTTPTETVPVSPFAVAKLWVTKELGERVWGMRFRGDDSLHVMTDGRGEFRFGPIGNSVQLEFIITHPDYAWTEFDQADGPAVRTVVQPGETVERTFELERGKVIAGQVVDDVTGKGIPDVLISVVHLARYKQHWWYRTRKRFGRTGRDGSFRISGLSYGPYNLLFRHPSFGEEPMHAVPEGSDRIVQRIKSVGGIVGRVLGLDERIRGRRIDLHLEAAGGNEGTELRQQFTAHLDENGEFLVSGVKPGVWRAWVRSGTMSSTPETVEVVGLDTVRAEFTLGGGGALRLFVADAEGSAVDPAIVRLQMLSEGGAAPRTLGQFVTRGGWLEIDGLIPGRYRAEARSPGYVQGVSEPFVIEENGETDAGAVTIRRQAFLRITGVVGPRGRAPRGDVVLSMKEGDGAFRRLFLQGRDLPVTPGEVTIRAALQGAEALSFEEVLTIGEGETRDLRIQLR